MSLRATLLIIAIALGAGIAGYFAGSYWLQSEATPSAAEAGVGDAAPSFELPDLGGQLVNPEDFRGKAILINFWATWCAPCRREMPHLMELHDSFEDGRAAVIGIALDREADVRSFVQELGIRYPILLAGDIEGTRLVQRYGNSQVLLPYSVFVRPDGTVDHAVLGEVTLEEARDRLLEILDRHR